MWGGADDMITISPLLSGEETLAGLESTSDATMLDFWRWGYSSLLFNDTRGVFGEWMVAKLLGIDPLPRDSWAAYDLVTPSGVRIEVKTTAYLQAWNPNTPSKTLTYTRLKGQAWTVKTDYASAATYNADLYVFCLQTETDPARWNALDLAQWRFFLLTQEHLAARDSRSITLSALRKCTQELTASEFQHEAHALIAYCEEK
jgi:hypothetical protein